ncbi:MAG: hypothetical protein M3680_32890 [Myxococcota bacterium]|nr:hypothetical protein [Myxococcota bacterium]
MKLVISWLGMLVLAGIVAASCSIKHPSDELACESQARCDEIGEGRECLGGYCVVPGGGGKVDAGPGPDARRDAAAPDATVCPAQCTSCNTSTKECIVDCAMSPSLCSAQIVCPAGWDCNLKCTTQNSCRNGVNCLDAKSCVVDCAGNSSCRNVACGPGECEVTCSGVNSCRGVACGQSCACDVRCAAPALCENVICTALQCNTLDGGCTSLRAGCETCP